MTKLRFRCFLKSRILFRLCFLICIACVTGCTEDAERNLPELITLAVRDIKTHSAVLGGFIISDGGTDVTARGICWGTLPGPEITGSKSDVGSQGTGRFTCTLSGLNQNSLYYVKAYAINREGTAYGNEVRFTTNPAMAPAVTGEVVSVSYYSAITGIKITDDGGAPVTEKGICLSRENNPTLITNDTVIKAGNYPDTDCQCFLCYVGPLQSGSAYYARAYAINAVDTSYGTNMSITTMAAPEVITGGIIEIKDDGATVEVKVISTGDVEGFEAGICYGTGKDPAIEGPHIGAERADTGSFKCNLTDLTPGTLYHIRAFVRWYSVDEWYTIYQYYTVYGKDLTFTTKELLRRF